MNEVSIRNGAERPIVHVEQVSKTFQRGKVQLEVLGALDLAIPAGSFDALMGPSGSGKSTLLNLIAGLDRPSSGRLTVAGVDVGSLSERERARWRAANIGFVFQQYNLMPVLTARENVELPLMLFGLRAGERRRRAEVALQATGLADRMQHLPNQLSGGQQQRVAIARALVVDPKLLLADEPTGDLDRQSASDILNLLGRLNKEHGKTIVMVTHDPAAAERANTVHRLDKGRLAS